MASHKLIEEGAKKEKKSGKKKKEFFSENKINRKVVLQPAGRLTGWRRIGRKGLGKKKGKKQKKQKNQVATLFTKSDGRVLRLGRFGDTRHRTAPYSTTTVGP